jgi:hypothetical protein
MFTIFLDRLPVHPNFHRRELRLARTEFSIYALYATERLETARQYSILHAERIVGHSSLST